LDTDPTLDVVACLKRVDTVAKVENRTTPKISRKSIFSRLFRSGRRVGMAEGHVTDAKSRLLAHGTTTCLIFPS